MMRKVVFHFLCASMVSAIVGAHAAELPVTRVVLFSSGVAYFQRDAEVEGDATAELSFRTEQINDLLKSLVLEDRGGGSIAPVTYGSRDPITRTLKSFAVDITDAPPLAALLGRLRGVKAIVSSTSSTQEIQGMILGVEKQQQHVKDNVVITIDVLNLLTDTGMRSFPLTQVQQIRLLDTTIDSELRKALELLATSHDTQRKPVTLAFTGKGKRPVRVAYILESPLWKTSYRLAVDGDRFFLQGWAIVENTTDEDWRDVRLSLVSGRPISFIQDLYQPLYVPRPVVRPELYASLMPQTYEGDMDESRRQRAAGEFEKRDAPADRAAARKPMVGAEGVVRGPESVIARDEANYLRLADSGVASLAQAKDVGEMFQYIIEQPVTLARQKSAMLPIVNQEVAGEKVSIFNERVHPKFPLNGLRLKNATKLHLMQGPITVFDEGAYAGDARIDNLQPGEERLLSYAMDLGVEVETQSTPNVDELVSAKVVKGVLFAERKYRMAKTYIIKNKTERKKIVLIEHPFNSAWRLIEPEKADERTSSVYRFRVNMDARATEKLLVKEGREDTQQIALISTDLDTIFIYLRSKNVSDKVKATLQKAVEMKTALNDIANQRASIEQQLREIDQEQSRLRANIGAVPQNSELYARYMKKLGDQETQVEQLRETLKNLRTKEAEQKKAVDDYLSGLEIE